MVDDWLLEHLAKVTTMSCVLIVVYVLIYSIWRISQMPNNPWNWNEWQWPIGGRQAVEIYRKPREMPFTLSLDELAVEDMGRCTFTLNYLKDKAPPEVTVMWGPAAAYLMRLINMPWNEFGAELMKGELGPGEWKSLIELPSPGNSSTGMSWMETANYFILHHINLHGSEVEISGQGSPPNSVPVVAESYNSIKFRLSPPIDFDWGLLRNQFRYPAVIFVTGSTEDFSLMEEVYEINGIIQVVHVKNEVFPNYSKTLAQYIKMNNGQSHILQSLYVMDDHRTEDSDSEDNENNGANNNDLSSSVPEQQPFGDILCSVCQVSPVTRVIIPCRHVCLCSQCFEKVQSCPICRGNIMYFFKTGQDPSSNLSNNVPSNESQNVSWWQRLERFNERFSDAIGLIRQY